MNILGISAFYHDSACALLQNGVMLAAAQEERFSRRKHDARFPEKAIRFCLNQAGLDIEDIDHIVFYEKPFLKFDRILFTHLNAWPFAFQHFWQMLNTWLSQKLKIPKIIRKQLGYNGSILFCQHHESHAASAFFSSPFSEATVLTVDGVGEWVTTAVHHGTGTQLKTLFELNFPDSLGLFYSAFTDFLGFEINDGEYKVMGMAPYGKPIYVDKIKSKIIFLNSDGSFQLSRSYFHFDHTDEMFNLKKISQLFGMSRRPRDEKLQQIHFDLAASVQQVLEEALVNIVRFAVQKTGSANVCLAGGVALNCRANSLLLNLPEVQNLFIFPAAGDAGGAAGAALFANHQLLNHDRVSPLKKVDLGPSFSDSEIEKYLLRMKIPFQKFGHAELCQVVAKFLFEQKIVGWFQGRMEFGPRALGNRSILGDPTRKDNWQKINQMIKFREDFRPLAPAVLAEKASLYFDFPHESPFMLLTAKNKTELIPAVTHLDHSSRLQTVNREDHPLFHQLLCEFEKYSGVPILINTSLNTAGMPIVCSPQNAFQAFAESRLDILVLGSYLIQRSEVPYLA